MKSAKFWLALLCALPLLQGCMDQTARSANDIAIEGADDSQCRKVGEPGTTAYNRCRATQTTFRDRMAPVPGAI